MKSFKSILIIIILLVVSHSSFAYKWLGAVATNEERTPTNRATANCEPPRTSTELYVNNVKTLIHTGGDMWWDLQQSARYEVPAGSGCHALYAGSIWVGGKDSNGQLKFAAQKFRQTGLDFWPGPLIVSGSERGNVEQEICREYDKHFAMSKEMVTEFRAWFSCKEDPECDLAERYPNGYNIPEEILKWPGNGPAGGYDNLMAPFYDMNDDDIYDPENDGDFPAYEFFNEGITPDANCERAKNQPWRRIFGDYTLWWVYNDRGNIHTETKGTAIGMEFKSQAFAFATNDELNDMTFYNYNIINRSTYTLYDTYFAVWTDADLGNPIDDYTGCDVSRGLGYMYNGDDNDENHSKGNGYGSQPPAIGIDFFEGPYQDDDGLDNASSWTINPSSGVKELVCDENILNGNINGLNFGDGEIDNERWGMRRFLYFNNSGEGNAATQDPSTAMEHYNYITGYWKDNSPLCYGGNGHFQTPGADINTPTDFMFPGDSDKCGWGQNTERGLGAKVMPFWSEETAGNNPYDRRFVQSAGPFTLYPGAVNDITLGAVYARANSGGPWGSVEAVRRADDKAQLLFENCFRVLNGPDAPDLNIVELDQKLIFHISNKATSNNYLDSYVEKDPSIVCSEELTPCDTAYRFQGYQVFQLKNSSSTVTNRYDDNLVRIIFQCDIKDGVGNLVNYTWSDDLGANVATKEVTGSDTGIEHTFIVDKDFFAAGSDNSLINNKEYYYTALAYGYNSTMKYSQADPAAFNGQKTPYIAGRNNIKRYEAIPHKTNATGSIMQSDYGDGVSIDMLEGYGNGNNIIDLTQESIDEIMKGYPWNVHNNRKYEKGRGPLNIKIIDPLNVPKDTYYVKFLDQISNIYGVIGTETGIILSDSIYKPFNYIIYNTKGDTIKNEVPIRYGDSYEQIFPNWGFSMTIKIDNYSLMGNRNSQQNGFLEATMEFDDPTTPWLYFATDTDYQNGSNWIRSGNYKVKEDGAAAECRNMAYDDITWTNVATPSNTPGFLDPDKYFGNILGATWAPYRLGNAGQYGVVYSTSASDQQINQTEPISSVDLVITKDKSKWTRSCVIEMRENEWKAKEGCPNIMEEVTPVRNIYSVGNAHKFALRKDQSVDKDGNPEGDTHGLGWFPGYAIDVRTGERLNIAFGEDSWLKGENGADMIWNPTSTYYYNEPLFGGKHFIYIFGNNMPRQSRFDGPAYDSCKMMHEKLMNYELTGSVSEIKGAWTPAMWVAIPMVEAQYRDTTDKADPYNFIKSDVKIRLRVATPYTRGLHDIAIADHKNNNYPMFTFTTGNVSTIFDDQKTKEDALNLIRVVPNPYYGNSDYEWAQLDNYVRITNLPARCDISIYTIAGNLVRRYKKDNSDTFVEWDLKNSSNISISSGVYIIHINAPGVGEKIVKWFGVLRPVDLNNF